MDRFGKIKDGPAIIDAFANGDTSGRFTVAKIAARLFPAARSFVEQVRKEGLDDPEQYVFAPWPADKLVHLSDFAISYVTPPGPVGLGTVEMEPSPNLPVSGIVLLTPVVLGSDAFNLEHLAIRLPLREQQLSDSILIEALTRAQSEAGSEVITAFYEALGHADGMTAAQYIVPEKRGLVSFKPKNIAQFYSSLRQPLALTSVRSLGGSLYEARYTFVDASGHYCDGRSVVDTVERNGSVFISTIRAMSGC